MLCLKSICIPRVILSLLVCFFVSRLGPLIAKNFCGSILADCFVLTSIQQPAKTLPEKHPQQPYPSKTSSFLLLFWCRGRWTIFFGITLCLVSLTIFWVCSGCFSNTWVWSPEPAPGKQTELLLLHPFWVAHWCWHSKAGIDHFITAHTLLTTGLWS